MAENDDSIDGNMLAAFWGIGIGLGAFFLGGLEALVAHVWTIVDILKWVLGIGIALRVLKPLVKSMIKLVNRSIDASNERKMAKALKQELVALSATINQTSRRIKSATTFSDELKNKWEYPLTVLPSELERYKDTVKAKLGEIDFCAEDSDNVSLSWANGQCEVKVNGRGRK